MKTPYRYIDEQHGILTPSDVDMSDESSVSLPTTVDQPEASPSPLLMVLIEQVCAKLNTQKAIDDGLPYVGQFIHRLFLKLASKVPSLTLLRPLLNHFKSKLSSEGHLPGHVAVIQEELRLLAGELDQIEGPENALGRSSEERLSLGDPRRYVEKLIASSKG